jgi:hypothetical protein
MPRLQVYLPDELHRQVKEQGLPASELLQEAVAAELDRRQCERQLDEYLAELVHDVGQPTPQMQARADAIARRIRTHALAASA